MAADPSNVHRSIEAVWKIESARLIGGLVRLVRDLDQAEDLAHEAMLAALERWPETGIPESPGAWLMTAAKNRAIDAMRRTQLQKRKHSEIAEQFPQETKHPVEEAPGDVVGDDTLRLIFIACHPILSREARVALTLRLVGGLTTEEIARAFLLREPTVAQRIVRAKRTLQAARVPFEVPSPSEIEERVDAVLEVIYLIFNEGYSASRGDDWGRLELCQDAMRLGRVLSGLVPESAEVHGLVALMELHGSRFRTRVDSAGRPVLLLDQARSRWDHLLIQRGLAALARAESLSAPLGPYTLQAAIAACHARARTPEETDWLRIVALYDALVEVTGSPVVELNRVVAVSMAFGPEAGLELVEQLTREPVLADYYLLPAVRGDILERLGRSDDARAAFERAAELAPNDRERRHLHSRARASNASTKKAEKLSTKQGAEKHPAMNNTGARAHRRDRGGS